MPRHEPETARRVDEQAYEAAGRIVEILNNLPMESIFRVLGLCMGSALNTQHTDTNRRACGELFNRGSREVRR